MYSDGFMWFDELDERQQREVQFAEVYADNYHHGTDGHSRLMLINTLAKKLYEYQTELNKLRKEQSQ